MTHNCYVNKEQCKKMVGKEKKKLNKDGKLDTIKVMVEVLLWEDDDHSVPKMCYFDYKNAKCKNTPGSYRCSCRKGFSGDGIGDTGCDDIDECGSAPCENAGGEIDQYGRETGCTDDGPLSYNCICNKGWTDTNCDQDVNECLMGAHDCHPEAKCVNTPGNYYCRCVSGFTGDGYTCTDLDDCDPDPCDPVHGTCHDQGANLYGCEAALGYTGPDAGQDLDECNTGAHSCDANADCVNTYGSYVCTCHDQFYGNAIVPPSGTGCAQCTDCEEYCPGEDEPQALTLATCGSDAWNAKGWEENTDLPACDVVDRSCKDINECLRLNSEWMDNCDDNAQCYNNPGSFTCACEREFWGLGTEGDCTECAICGIGESLYDDCTVTTDRECRVTVPDGNYALMTHSNSIEQCLVHWKEPGKIYPSRYSWGGRATTQTEGANELGDAGKTQTYGSEWRAGEEGAKPAPDYCKNPICGVCEWNEDSAADNLVKGMEAVWTFKRLHDDLYLILNGADGNGFRCLGFQTPEAPYPTMISWSTTTMDAARGVCNATDPIVECGTDNDCQPVKLTVSAVMDAVKGQEVIQTKVVPGYGSMPDKTIRHVGYVSEDSDGTVVTVVMKEGDFGPTNGANLAANGELKINGVAKTITAVAANYDDVNSHCVKESLHVGEWRTDEQGVQPDEIENCDTNRAGLKYNCRLGYFCGFKTDSNGGARTKLLSNGGAVWNVHKLGCTKDAERRWQCEANPKFENQYVVRSLAGQDVNLDNSITKMDYECLYFPQIGGGEYTHPRRTPRSPSANGVWGGMSADADGNNDNECGILPEAEDESQEDRLVLNKQATWSLIPLPDY